VYDIVAYWTWNPNGWLLKLGGLDFAGGGPVHLASGCAALAYAIVIGHREGFGKETFRPHNISHVILGTALLWFGWFGFNGGSEVAANARAANAAVVTHMAASIAGLTWMALDYWFESGKLTSMGFCAGCVSGLVTITPASGYVTPASALAIGAIGAACCFAATKLKTKVKFDDAMDVFAVHGVGGMVGSILTGIFADSWVWTLDGSDAAGGWLNANFRQVGLQLAGILAIGGWSFVISYIILTIMDRIPWIGLRVPPEHESIGTDLALMGELAYRYETNVPIKRPTTAQISPAEVEMEKTQSLSIDP
jgi:Amt family ammonium transporter